MAALFRTTRTEQCLATVNSCPAHQRGYYREYTVKTPGARNRGARRIVCGGKPQGAGRLLYTSDHYASFHRIVE